MSAGLVSAVAADDTPATDAVRKDIARFQGTWKTTSLRWNGKDLDTDGKFAMQFVFNDAEATIESSKEVKKEYAKITFMLDPSTSPPCVDLKIAAGVQKDAVIEGIYELKDDELKICAKVFGNDRPAAFESAEGSSIVLIVLKREKP